MKDESGSADGQFQKKLFRNLQEWAVKTHTKSQTVYQVGFKFL